MRPVIVFSVLATLCLGCSNAAPAPTATSSDAASSTTAQGGSDASAVKAPAIPRGADGMEGGGGSSKAELDAMTSIQAKAKAAFAKDPSATNKTNYVDATVKLATATMSSGALPPHDKYPGALKLYREALKVDPTNKEANDNSKMIIDVYNSMGKAVPKE